MPMYGALALFLVFTANVAAGALTRKPFFGDLTEMLILFATAILFVIAILQKEAAAKKK